MKRQQLISALLAAALCAAPAAMAAAVDASPTAVADADAAANRRADLQTLMDTLERVHPDLYANTPKADFEAKRAAIEADIASMSEIDFAIAAAELVALVRDSHTGVNINLLMDKLTYLPVNLARMHEGWVIAALPRSQSADLGSTVTAVNGIPIANVQARISAMVSADNRAYADRQTGSLLTIYDVPLLNYLSPYAVWAQKNGIIYGETPSSLVPNRAVTRQELAAVLSRYAAFRGQTLPAGHSTPSDAAEISPWALDAVRSLTESGVLPLENGAFRPRGTVDRTDLPGILDRLRAAAQ